MYVAGCALVYVCAESHTKAHFTSKYISIKTNKLANTQLDKKQKQLPHKQVKCNAMFVFYTYKEKEE